MDQSYLSLTPCPELAPFISRYWYSKMDIPQGFCLELLPANVQCICFVLNGPVKQQLVTERGMIQTADCYVTGQLTRHATGFIDGAVELLSAQMKAFGMYALFGVPMHYFTDYTISLEDIIRPDEKAFLDQIRYASGITGKIKAMEAFFLQRLRRSRCADKTDRVAYAHDLIIEMEGNVTVQQLLSEVNMSERTLQRSFSEQIGVNPKMFSSIIRIKKIMQMVEGRASLRWRDVSYELGYTDPAHMAKDFKRLVGKTPSAYFDTKGDFEAFFSV